MRLINFILPFIGLIVFALPSFSQDAALDTLANNVAADTLSVEKKPVVDKMAERKEAAIKELGYDPTTIIMPKFRGKDFNEFRKWVRSQVQYPSAARMAKAQGVVVVKFVVGKDGKISDVTVLKAPHKSLGDEVSRVIKKSPKLTPAQTPEGEVVSIPCDIAVNFETR